MRDIFLLRDLRDIVLIRRSEVQAWTISDFRRELERCSEIINAPHLAPTSKSTYLVHADRFVGWLAGEVEIRRRGPDLVERHASSLGGRRPDRLAGQRVLNPG